MAVSVSEPGQQKQLAADVLEERCAAVVGIARWFESEQPVRGAEGETDHWYILEDFAESEQLGSEYALVQLVAHDEEWQRSLQDQLQNLNHLYLWQHRQSEVRGLPGYASVLPAVAVVQRDLYPAVPLARLGGLVECHSEGSRGQWHPEHVQGLGFPAGAAAA